MRALLHKTRTRRVAVAGFVGRDAHRLIGDVRGLEIYCWPSPTCTSALGLQDLVKRGAIVHFVDNLHTKLYWADGRALIGSANLSYNGVGGGLIEHMVYVDITERELDAVIRTFDARIATPAELERLRRANERSRAGPGVPNPEPESDETPTFEDWWASGRRDLDRIRLSWYSDQRNAADSTRDAAVRAGFDQPLSDWMSARLQSTLPVDSWVLYLKTDDNARVGQRRRADWMFVHGVSKMSLSERADLDPEHPWEAYQVGDVRDPPFRIDARVARALAKAWREVIEPVRSGDQPDEKVLASPPVTFFEIVRRSLETGPA